MADGHLFSNISLGGRGGTNPGQLRVYSGGVIWKKQKGGKTVEVDKSDLLGLTWMKDPRSHQLGVRTGDGLYYKFTGFKDQDVTSLNTFFQSNFGATPEEKQLSVSGKNWGEVDLNDIFESSLTLEETHLKEGYDEGHADGLISGKEEGKEVGLKSGFEVGEELGFYRGCVNVWNSVIQIDPNFFSIRIQKTIKQMDDLLQKYPMLEPENEVVSDMMNTLRLKFRAICASLNLKLEYDGYPKASGVGDIQF